MWLRAGQELLREGGIVAVKIHALIERTDLTTGSFYHHFRSMAAYLDELADQYAVDTPLNLESVSATDPRSRLHELAAIAPRDDLVPLDQAMRDWAGANARAAQAVTLVDENLLTFLRDAFLDLGHNEADAQLRAIVMMSSGVARVATPWPRAGDETQRLIDLLAHPF